MGPPATLQHRNLTWCPTSHEPPSGQISPMQPPHNVLFILGPEHSGARALEAALATDATFVQPVVEYRCALQIVCDASCLCKATRMMSQGYAQCQQSVPREPARAGGEPE